MSSTIQAVLFDLDDTLFDHSYSLQTSLAEMQRAYPSLRQYPLAELTSAYVALLETTHAQILRGLLTQEQARLERIQKFFLKYGESLSPAQADAAVMLYRETYRAARRPVAGAVALLEHLRGRARIGVVTNNTKVEQIEKLETCGLTHLIDALVISGEVGIFKPNPAIFRIALDRLDCGPGQAVMIGDSWEVDVVGAREAGIAPVWFNRFGAASPGPGVVTVDALEPVEAVAALLLAACRPKY